MHDEALYKLQQQLREQIDHVAGVPERFTKPLTYVYTPAGVYEARVTNFATFVAKVDSVPGVSMRDIAPGIYFTHGKIPFRFLLQALDFFRKAYALPRKSEALYMIFFDPQNKIYVPYVPRQWDGPAHAKEIDASERPAGMTLVAHIHSHPGFSGRFSGIDDNDDRRCSDAAIFGVLGHINRDVPDMEWRISVGGKYVGLDVFDIFTSPFHPADLSDCTAPEEWLQKIEEPPQEQYRVRTFEQLGHGYHNWIYPDADWFV